MGKNILGTSNKQFLPIFFDMFHEVSTIVIVSIFFSISVSIFVSPAKAATENNAIEGESKRKVSITPTAHNVCFAKKTPVWPLEQLNKEETEARLRFFIQQYDFQVREEGTGSEKHCLPLLLKLQNSDNLKVIGSDKDWAKNPSCANINDMTQYEYFDGKKRPSIRRDSEELSLLAVSDKEKKSDFFYRQTDQKYTQYYDLSKYFGLNSWGVLAESVAVQYNPRHGSKICVQGWDAYRQAGVIGRVFNLQSCKSYFLPLLSLVQRLRGDADRYEPTPSFAAFVDIDGKPYILAFQFSDSWNDFSRLLNPQVSAPRLLLTQLQDPQEIEENVAGTSSCFYQAIRKN